MSLWFFTALVVPWNFAMSVLEISAVSGGVK
jgi:hypothetical protein